MADPAARSTTAAWAAAAVVLAVGSFGFALVQHLRADDLEERLDRIEALRPTPAPVVAATSTSTVLVAGGQGSTTVAVTAATGPLDPVAARTAIEAAVARVYDGTLGPLDRVASVDDGSGVEAALNTLHLGPYALGARSSQAVVVSVEFTSATRASVTYAVSVQGAPPLATRSGEARVVGGGWKLTRETVCADLAALGAPCP